MDKHKASTSFIKSSILVLLVVVSLSTVHCIDFNFGTEIFGDCELKGTNCTNCMEVSPECGYCSRTGLCLNSTKVYANATLDSEKISYYGEGFCFLLFPGNWNNGTCSAKALSEQCTWKYQWDPIDYEKAINGCSSDPQCGWCSQTLDPKSFGRCILRAAPAGFQLCSYLSWKWNFTADPIVLPNTTLPTHSSSGVNKGLVAGVTVTVAVVLIASVLIGAFLIARRNKRAREARIQEAMEMVDVPLTLSNHLRTAIMDWVIDYEQLDIEEELGESAYGKIYKATWRNAECCVKQLSLDSKDAKVIKMFVEEVIVMKKLKNHPNLVSLIGVSINPKHPLSIVTEYCQSVNLKSFLASVVFINGDIILQLAKDIASGLLHLHSEDVVHKNLCSTNILVLELGNRRYKAKIGDFGINVNPVIDKEIERSKEDKNYNSPTSIIKWEAPEVLRSKEFSPASDIFSYGIILWEIIGRKLPYPNMTVRDVYNEVTTNQYRMGSPDNPSYPKEFDQLIQSCWKENPAERPNLDTIFLELEKIEMVLATRQY